MTVSFKDVHIFRELLIPFLIKLSSKKNEFNAFMENLMNTGDILDNKRLIPELIDCIYLTQNRACQFNRRKRNLQ